MKARHLSISAIVTGLAFWAVLLLGGPAARADYKDDMGYTALYAELGDAAMPKGVGISVSQVEALYQGLYYVPNALDTRFSGKTFTLKGGSSGNSTHATYVGYYYYGLSTSVAPSITAIDVYRITDIDNSQNFLYGAFLKTGTVSAPVVEHRLVQSSSWAWDTTDDVTIDEEMVRRYDYAIGRDNFVGVVAVDNGTSSPVPNMLAASYNAIAVGLSNGNHSRGGTLLDEPGRMKPDIVASSTGMIGPVVSYVTPLVSGTAADLLQVANASSAMVLARNSETVKAIILAGATKTPFTTWSRTPTTPLDAVYGAGQLNIYNSYHILTAGRQQPGTSAAVSPAGWDFNTISTDNTQTQTYFFDVPTTAALKEFSVILTWNRVITDGDLNPSRWDNPQAFVANLNLKLYNASGFALGTLVDSSVSEVDNVEHIYGSLLPGRYALQVSDSSVNPGGITSTEYALAWRNRPTIGGDANLSGTVDLQDFSLLKANYDLPGRNWAQGDFNGDHLIDLQDFSILKANYNMSIAGLAPFLSSPAAGATADPGITPVPEPVSMALLLAALPFLRRPRRQ